MCYSALVWADYRRYIRDFNAELDIKEFYELFCRHIDDARIKVPKAMEAAFVQPETDAQRQIKAAIDTFAAAETVRLEQGLFEQRKRLAERNPAGAIELAQWRTKVARVWPKVKVRRIDTPEKITGQAKFTFIP